MTERTMTEAEARAILAEEEQTRKNMSAAQRKRREKVKMARALIEHGELAQKAFDELRKEDPDISSKPGFSQLLCDRVNALKETSK